LNKENLHSGHRNRLRKRAVENGLNSFNEHQILELILSFYLPRVDTNPIAHKLIKEFGSLALVLEAETKDLLSVSGMGEKSASFLHLIPEILKSYKKSKMQRGVIITSPKQAHNYIGEVIKYVPKEEFYLICLDSKSKVLVTKLLAKGTNSQVGLSLKQITQTAIQASANGVILVHNHPSGNSEPSTEDIILTKKVYLTLSLNNICVMDHLVISKEDYYSFNQKGFFSIFSKDFSSLLDFNTLMQKAPEYKA